MPGERNTKHCLGDGCNGIHHGNCGNPNVDQNSRCRLRTEEAQVEQKERQFSKECSRTIQHLQA